MRTDEVMEKTLELAQSQLGNYKRGNMDDESAPYPDMATAFEAHFGQSWKDKDWKNETSIWAAAWKAAKRHNDKALGSEPRSGEVQLEWRVMRRLSTEIKAMTTELTNSEREQIAEILKRRANEIAGFSGEYRNDQKHFGSVELALSRETDRLRRLAERVSTPEPEYEGA